VTFYKDLDQHQVVALHKLIRFLRRLRVIGKLHTTTMTNRTPTDPLSFAMDEIALSRYWIRYDDYTSDTSEMDVEEKLESVFGRMNTDPAGDHFEF
jgi:hypothetical protein